MKTANIPYCLPIIKTQKKDVLTTLKKYEHEYSYCEVWLDYIADFSLDFIDSLIQQYEKKLIVLFRRQHLEKPTMNSEQQQVIIKRLENTEVLLDLDIENQYELLQSVRTENIRLITSYHNYEHTPSDEILTDILQKMSTYHPSIYKISTFCNSPDDALRLMKLLLQLKTEQKHGIMLGMGEYGTITRVFGTLWGNAMIFAPREQKEASAPGQLTKGQLTSIVKELGGTYGR